MQHLLSIATTCETLGVSKQTLYRLIRERQLRPVKIGDRTLFRPEDVEAFITRSLMPEGSAE